MDSAKMKIVLSDEFIKLASEDLSTVEINERYKDMLNGQAVTDADRIRAKAIHNNLFHNLPSACMFDRYALAVTTVKKSIAAGESQEEAIGSVVAYMDEGPGRHLLRGGEMDLGSVESDAEAIYRLNAH